MMMMTMMMMMMMVVKENLPADVSIRSDTNTEAKQMMMMMRSPPPLMKLRIKVFLQRPKSLRVMKTRVDMEVRMMASLSSLSNLSLITLRVLIVDSRPVVRFEPKLWKLLRKLSPRTRLPPLLKLSHFSTGNGF